MSTIMHCHAEKRWAKEQIRRFGARAVLGLDVDVETGCRLVDELESEYVPVGACDNRGPDGICRGHWKPEIVGEESEDDDG